ncbi:RNA binding-protein [Aureococcus anophagefferens]|nr:RNA binding-protein [Aureococcus anophagefferens]
MSQRPAAGATLRGLRFALALAFALQTRAQDSVKPCPPPSPTLASRGGEGTFTVTFQNDIDEEISLFWIDSHGKEMGGETLVETVMEGAKRKIKIRVGACGALAAIQALPPASPRAAEFEALLHDLGRPCSGPSRDWSCINRIPKVTAGPGYAKMSFTQPMHDALTEWYAARRHDSMKPHGVIPGGYTNNDHVLIDKVNLDHFPETHGAVLREMREILQWWTGLRLKHTSTFGVRVYRRSSLIDHADRMDTHLAGGREDAAERRAGPLEVEARDVPGVAPAGGAASARTATASPARGLPVTPPPGAGGGGPPAAGGGGGGASARTSAGAARRATRRRAFELRVEAGARSRSAADRAAVLGGERRAAVRKASASQRRTATARRAAAAKAARRRRARSASGRRPRDPQHDVAEARGVVEEAPPARVAVDARDGRGELVERARLEGPAAARRLEQHRGREGPPELVERLARGVARRLARVHEALRRADGGAAEHRRRAELTRSRTLRTPPATASEQPGASPPAPPGPPD